MVQDVGVSELSCGPSEGQSVSSVSNRTWAYQMLCCSNSVFIFSLGGGGRGVQSHVLTKIPIGFYYQSQERIIQNLGLQLLNMLNHKAQRERERRERERGGGKNKAN